MTPAEMRTIREGAGLTQAALARLFRIAEPRTIRRYETGEMRPSGPVTLLYEKLRDGELGCRLPAPWDAPLLHTGSGKPLAYRQGGAVLLDLYPRVERLSVERARMVRVVQEDLRPLGGLPECEREAARSRRGEATFQAQDGAPDVVAAVGMVTRGGSLHGADFRALSAGVFVDVAEPCVPVFIVTRMLLLGLRHLLDVAGKMFGHDGEIGEDGFTGAAALSGVAGLRIALGRSEERADLAGAIVEDRIEGRFDVRFTSDPLEALRPFFEAMYDAGGETRPDARFEGPRDERPRRKRPRL